MATANPRRRRKSTRRRNAAPAATATNPRRRRRATTRRRRRNPTTLFARAASPAVNPRRRRRRNPGTALATNPRRRRATHRRRRNPVGNPGSIGGAMKFVVAAGTAGLLSSLIGQATRFLPIPQGGIVGLLAQVGVALGVTIVLPKTGLIKQDTANLVGTVMGANAIAQFAAPYLDLSQFLPASSGMGDVQYIRNGQWPFGNRGFNAPNGMNDVQYISNGEWPFGNTGFAPINGIPAVPYT